RFFLCRVPADQEPRLFTEETSEGFWIHPGHGYRRFLAGEMKMAEPAEYGLAWVAQFHSIEELWTAHADGRAKFHGIIDRLDAYGKKIETPYKMICEPVDFAEAEQLAKDHPYQFQWWTLGLVGARAPLRNSSVKSTSIYTFRPSSGAKMGQEDRH